MISIYGVYSTEAQEAITALAEHTKKKNAETKDDIEKTFTDSMGIVQTVVGKIADVYDALWAGQLTAIDNDYKTRKAYIEANVDDEDDRKTQLEALDKEYAAKKAKIAKDQWILGQAVALANIAIDTAMGIVKAVAEFPGPIGIALGVAMGVLGLAQAGIVASQPMPTFAAEGGVFHSGESVIVGERGPELLSIGQTSRITPNGEFGQGFTQHVQFYGDIHKDVDLDIASYKLARRVRSALRSS
jgi:hypothetical protein